MMEKQETPDVTTVMGTGDAEGFSQTKETPAETVYEAPAETADSLPSVKNPRYWMIARVAPNTERSSAAKLNDLGYEVFVAAQKELRIWKNGLRNKKKWVERVVITQYIFLHITKKQREEVIRYSFVKAFMKDSAAKDRTAFAVVPDSEMASLTAMFGQSDYPVAFAPSDFQIGQEVTLSFGSSDHTAKIVRKKGDDSAYFGIRINELGCAYMEVPATALR
jgi:hypothetical protein